MWKILTRIFRTQRSAIIGYPSHIMVVENLLKIEVPLPDIRIRADVAKTGCIECWRPVVQIVIAEIETWIPKDPLQDLLARTQPRRTRSRIPWPPGPSTLKSKLINTIAWSVFGV
jgi:hypothetical protein